MYLKNAFVTERQKTPFYVQLLTKNPLPIVPPLKKAIALHTPPLFLLGVADL